MIQITVCHSPIYHKRLTTQVRGRSFSIAHGLNNRCVVLSYHTPTCGDGLVNRVRWANSAVCEDHIRGKKVLGPNLANCAINIK
jgi:hypothetical protein